MNIGWDALFSSVVLTWSVGLVAPLLLRFIVFRRKFRPVPAGVASILLFFANVTFFISLGSTSRTHAALVVVAFVSYLLLTKDFSDDTVAKSTPLQGSAFGESGADRNDGKRPNRSDGTTFSDRHLPAVWFAVLVVLVVTSIYFVVSPYQNCIRDRAAPKRFCVEHTAW